MDSPTQVVRDFFASLLPVQEALDDLHRKLNRRPQVKRVRAYKFEAVSSPEFGLSADLHNGSVVDFWLSLTSDETGWELEYSVFRPDPPWDSARQEFQFPRQSIRSVLDMPSALIAAIKALEHVSADDALYR